MNIALQLLINGILLGSFYMTMALGFSNIWGVMRLINLAHGEFLLLAAFVGWFFFNPTREQNFVFPMSEVETSSLMMFLIVGLIWLVAAWVVSEVIINERHVPDVRLRRGGSTAMAVVLGVLTTRIWEANGFQPLTISVMTMVLAGLVLSIGLFLSHFVLGTVIGQPLTWKRRAIGYGSGAIFVGAFYLLWKSNNFNSIDPFLALPLVFVLFFGAGFVLQKVFLNRLIEGPYLTMLLVTFGIAIILQNLMLQVYAADPRKINVDYGSAIQLGSEDLTISTTKIFTLLVSVLMVTGLILFLRYTHIGYAVRAAAQNKMAAKLMGININDVYAITFAISLGLTAAAGVMMGTFQAITPVTGAIWTLRAFSIVALGGLGKVEGVVVGGLLLGIAESFIGGYVGVGWAIGTAFIMLVLVLVIRPQGIMGGLTPAEE